VGVKEITFEYQYKGMNIQSNRGDFAHYLIKIRAVC
jgi:hypothetical protein